MEKKSVMPAKHQKSPNPSRRASKRPRPKRVRKIRASAEETGRELIRAAMKEMKGMGPAPKKLSVDGADGARHNHNGAKHASSFEHPKTELEAAIQRYVDLYEFAPV